MNLTISCPDCQRLLHVPEDLLGQAVKCPSCSHTFVVPEGVEEPPRPPAEQSSKIAYEDEPRPPKLPVHDDDYDYEPSPSRGPRLEKPGKLQAVAAMMLAGGIYACIWSMGMILFSGFACCLWPGAYYGLVMGIMAIVRGSNLLGNHAHRLTPPQGIAIMMIVNLINGDIVNLTLGILALVFLSDPEVKAYFRG